MPSRVVFDNSNNNLSAHANPAVGLEPIPGDTYPLRVELKALGAVWDRAGRVWCIAPEKLPLAAALVEHQGLIPPKTLPTDENGEVLDPFDEDVGKPRTVVLGPQDGASYNSREALRALGARWDKVGRVWTIGEERAPYARAVLKAVAAAQAPASSARATGNKAKPEPEEER